MSGRKLAILALILVVLGLGAYLSRKPSETQRSDSPGNGDKLFANLDVNAIALVEIKAGGSTNTISKKEDTWVIGSLFDYPADRSKIVEQLRGLKFLKIGQPMLGGDKILDEFELGENCDIIRFFDAGGTELAALRIGKARIPKTKGQPPAGPAGFGGMPDGRYISTDGSNVILIDDSLTTWVGDDDGWVQKQLLSVNGTDITTVTVSSNDTSYTLNFEGSETTLADLAEDEKLDTGDAGRVQRALSYLSFESIADPALSDEDAGMGNPVTYRATGKDGIVHDLRIGGSPADGGDTRYARIEVVYNPPSPPTTEDAEALVPSEAEPVEATGEGTEQPETPTIPREELVQKKLDQLLAEHQGKVDEAEKKVEDLARLRDWTFLLSKYSADSIALGRGQLVEKVEEETEDSGESADVTTGSEAVDSPTFTAVPDSGGEEAPDEDTGSKDEPASADEIPLPPISPAE